MLAVPGERPLSDAAAPRRKPAPVRPHWVSKTLAGLLLGLTLALTASALLAALLADLPISERGQLAMWSVPPVWLGVLSGVYFFASGWRAWLWLGGVNLLAYGLLLAVRLAAQAGVA